jgi:hypothetical protein
VEEGHFVAGCAVTFSEAGCRCCGRIGGDYWRREGEVDLVFCEGAVAGAVVEAAGWGRGGCGGVFG